MGDYIESTEKQGIEFFKQFVGKGEILMLNLLKFKEIADYSEFPELAPTQEISGKTAYQNYIKGIQTELHKIGSELIIKGTLGNNLIGPTDEKWDQVIIMKHKSVEQFIQFSQNPIYLKFNGHRTASILDSRLIPFQ